MTELEVPIKRSLREPSVPIDRLWAQIEARRARGAAPAWLQISGFAGALGAAFVLAALAVMYWAPRHAAQNLHPDLRTAGPLRRANGEVLGVLDTSQGGAALDVALSDGSRIRLEPGAKLVPERSDARQFRAAVQRGTIVFDVRPAGPRRWIVDAGDTRVEVVGTRFSVSNESGWVAVAVERGRVEVRGPSVPQGMQTLGPAERLRIGAPPSAANPTARAAVRSDGNAAVGGGVAGVAGDALAEPSPDQLLKAADAARAIGDYQRAARTLQRFLSAHPSDAQAAIVALTLGRIQLDHLNASKAAVATFIRADRLGLPDAVAEEGAARLVEAYAKSGDKDKARAAAARYARRFPDGARSESVAMWLDLL